MSKIVAICLLVAVFEFLFVLSVIVDCYWKKFNITKAYFITYFLGQGMFIFLLIKYRNEMLLFDRQNAVASLMGCLSESISFSVWILLLSRLVGDGIIGVYKYINANKENENIYPTREVKIIRLTLYAIIIACMIAFGVGLAFASSAYDNERETGEKLAIASIISAITAAIVVVYGNKMRECPKCYSTELKQNETFYECLRCGEIYYIDNIPRTEEQFSKEDASKNFYEKDRWK